MSPDAERAAEVHCQQAVEKALKALLTWHETPFRKTHSLEELGRACCAIDSSLRVLVDEAVPLTEFAWAFRYPGPPPAPELDEARAAIDIAGRVARAVAERVPFEAVPEGLA